MLGFLIVAVMIVVFIIFSMPVKVQAASEVKIYSVPEGIPKAFDREVYINGTRIDLYDTAVNFNRAFVVNPVLETTPAAYFDFGGSAVSIRVRTPGTEINRAVIRPVSLGIKYEKTGFDTIEFTLNEPAKLTIEINEDLHRALHLFANPPETDSPKKGDKNVIYFEPGVHKAGKINVKSDDTVYIAGGAVVYGWIHAEGVTDLKILGRGVLDGSIYDRWKNKINPISIRNSDNCTVDGICIFNPAAWTLEAYKSTNIRFNNVKIISARENSDGITVQSCHNLKATDCFVRSWDDCLVVKGYNGDVSHNYFENIQVWNDLAQCMEVGFETRAKEMKHIHFNNITVLHALHKPVISIHNGDRALVKDVVYENITVEDCSLGQGNGLNYLIDLWVGTEVWSKDDERGNVRDVYIRNVKVLEGTVPQNRVEGYDADHTIENVFISGLCVMGENIGKLSLQDFILNQYSKNIVINENEDN